MKRALFVPKALAFVLAGACSLAGVACHRAEGPGRASVTTTTAGQEPLSASIYALEASLRDFDGRAIGLDAFRGHPVLVSMFYGSCPAACPLLVSHMKQIEASLAPSVRSDLRVLLVSFDAERDTPAALRGLASAHHVDTARWRLASAPDDTARAIANLLGIEYQKGEEGFFSHNSVISVLDRDGRIVARTDDPSADLTPLVAAVARLSEQQ